MFPPLQWPLCSHSAKHPENCFFHEQQILQEVLGLFLCFRYRLLNSRARENLGITAGQSSPNWGVAFQELSKILH